jgi:hypothetical protein
LITGRWFGEGRVFGRQADPLCAPDLNTLQRGVIVTTTKEPDDAGARASNYLLSEAPKHMPETPAAAPKSPEVPIVCARAPERIARVAAFGVIGSTGNYLARNIKFALKLLF